MANFPANTGYAWDFIESLYAGVADALAPSGVRTFVAYPAITAPPRPLAGSAAAAVELDVRFDNARCMRATLRFVRRNRIQMVYLADRPTWTPAYLALRLAGVRRIILHDHTSGERTRPTGLKRWLKAAARRIRPLLADHVVAVSDYVRRRQLEVELVPPERITRIWNTLPAPAEDPGAADRLRHTFGIPAGALVVACAGRATPEKGFQHLLHAFDTLLAQWRGVPPWLVYMGDGPALGELRLLRDRLRGKDRIVLAGHRRDAASLLGGADVCVVPSVWQEGFGLAALEPMLRGVPVVVTRVGGLAEVVEDGVTGMIVEPGAEAGLAAALTELLRDPERRRRLGVSARVRARERFSREAQIRELASLISFGVRLSGRGAAECTSVEVA